MPGDILLKDGRVLEGTVRRIAVDGLVIEREGKERTLFWTHLSPKEMDKRMSAYCEREGPLGLLLAVRAYGEAKRFDRGRWCIKRAKSLGVPNEKLKLAAQSFEAKVAMHFLPLARQALQADRPAAALRLLLKIQIPLLEENLREEALHLKEAGETALTLSAPSQPVNPSLTRQPLEILLVESFQEKDCTVVAGKIQNRSLRCLAGASLEIKATGGKKLYEQTKRLNLSAMDSGDSSTFSCLFEDPGPLDIEINAKPKLAEKEPELEEKKLSKEPISVEVVRAIKGNHEIVFLCSLKNMEACPYEKITLVATFYDSAGNAVHTSRLKVPPPPLNPREDRLVELTASSWVDFHAYQLSLDQMSPLEPIH